MSARSGGVVQFRGDGMWAGPKWVRRAEHLLPPGIVGTGWPPAKLCKRLTKLRPASCGAFLFASALGSGRLNLRGNRLGQKMTTPPPVTTTTIRQLEFELEKAEHGMAMPYDAERVAQLRHLLREARMRKLSDGLRARRDATLGHRPGRMNMSTPLNEALIALTDALAKRPAEEILFQWFRSGRLIGELSNMMKRRHPAVQAEIDRVYQEHQAKRAAKESN
jgi:hypothetical protein